MRIAVAERLRPFSHIPGTCFLLPGSSLRFQAFPALLRIHDLAEKEPRFIAEIPLDVTGPVKDFTIMQDLEKGLLRIWGHTAKGFMRYRISARPESPEGFAIAMEKFPDDMTNHSEYGNAPSTYIPPSIDRLSLGSQKAQDWNLMLRRRDLAEILPLWFRLGQLIPNAAQSIAEGTAMLLQFCRKSIESQKRVEICSAFNDLFSAGFECGLSPRLIDEQHQGYHLPPLTIKNAAGGSPLSLLTEGASLIRQLFVQFQDLHIHVLPVLPPDFHCGRLIQTQCGTAGVMDLEWSKHLTRRMTFTAQIEGQLQFHFQKELRRFRLRRNQQDRGQTINCNEPIDVHAGESYYFDRFEK